LGERRGMAPGELVKKKRQLNDYFQAVRGNQDKLGENGWAPRGRLFQEGGKMIFPCFLGEKKGGGKSEDGKRRRGDLQL